MKVITPGEILLEDYLKPMGISQNALARALGISPRKLCSTAAAVTKDHTQLAA